MAYHDFTLDLSTVETQAQFHQVLKTTFRFADSYEPNTRGLIDGLYGLQQSENRLSTLTQMDSSDVLVIKVTGLSGRSKGIIRDFIEAIEATNHRVVRRGGNRVLLLDLGGF